MALNQVGLERLNTATTKKIGTNKNLIINGAMNVSQRATSSTGLGASAGYFTLDRYRTTFSSTAGRLTMSQVADVHDGFANAMKFECTTADTSVAAGEYFILQQKFEGQDLQQLKKGSSDAEEFTVSFYVKGNASATYVVEMYDLDNNRQVGKTFSVTTSWTRVELTFPADTTGALDDDNAASLQLGIWLHAGSNYTSGTLATSWISNVSAQRAGGITSFFDSTDRTFFLTGLQLEVGSVATPFEHRSFGDEMARCKRYYNKVFDAEGQSGEKPASLAVYETNSVITTIFNFPKMRSVPSLDITNGTNKFMVRSNSVSDHFDTLTLRYGTSQSAEITQSSGVSGTAGYGGYLRSADTDVYIAFSAEL